MGPTANTQNILLFALLHTYIHTNTGCSSIQLNILHKITTTTVCVCVRLDVYFILMLLPEMIQCWLLWWWWSSSLLWNSSFGFYSKILLFIQSFSILDNGGDSLGPFRQRSNIEKRKKNHQSSFRIFYFIRVIFSVENIIIIFSKMMMMIYGQN